MEEFLQALDIEHRFRPGAAKMWGKFQPEHTKNKIKYRGLTKHTDEELWKFCNDDIQCIEDALGSDDTDGPYIFGAKPTLADCAIFGHLSQFLFIPINFPQQKYVKENCPNLISFMDHFKKEIWPDWDDICNTKIDYPQPTTTGTGTTGTTAPPPSTSSTPGQSSSESSK